MVAPSAVLRAVRSDSLRVGTLADHWAVQMESLLVGCSGESWADQWEHWKVALWAVQSAARLAEKKAVLTVA